MDKQKLISLAKEYNTPLFVYDGDLIKKRYNEFFSFIPYNKLKVKYAMKANYNLAILKLLEQEGAGIDAVSPGDVHMALTAGFTPDRILFTANKITDAEMHEVKSLGVLFNMGSLSRLKKYGKTYPNSEICLRFNPDVVAGEHEFIRTGGEATKFGILLNKLEEVKSICKEFNLTVIGIHEHTGSGIPETVQMMKGMQNILKIIRKENFPDLNFVDFGGGFQIPYKPGEERKDYHKLGEQSVELFKETCELYGKELEFWIEPGKYIVSESGYLLTTVNTLKENRSKLIAGTDSGFPQLIRPMFYQAYHHITNLSNLDGDEKLYDVAGNICETGDCFAVNRPLPEIREGDVLALHNAGAYCYAMGGVYNLRAMPAEVLIFNGVSKLVRKRLSSKELIEKIVGESL
jgi:diaminopimelate decarboxylase